MAYLPTQFGFETVTGNVLHDHCIEIIQKVFDSPHAIPNIMEPCAMNAVSAISCITKDEFCIRLHNAIVSYSADLPEKKDFKLVLKENELV